jgi:hypothetical protein
MMRIFSAALMLTVCLSVAAQDSAGYVCSLDDAVRRVEILYETGVTVPCEVHYYKDTEMPGERQVLWRARNEEGYCEARAAEFVEMLRGMGWTCRATGQSDDTDALSPAEEEIEITEAEATSGG